MSNTKTNTKADEERTTTVNKSRKAAATSPSPPTQGNLKKPPPPHPGAGSQMLTPAQLKLLHREEEDASSSATTREVAAVSSSLKPLGDDIVEKKAKKSPQRSPRSKSSKSTRQGGSRSPSRRNQSPKSSRSVLGKEVHGVKLAPPLTSQSLPLSQSPSALVSNSDVTEKVRSRTNSSTDGGRQMKSVRRIRPVSTTTPASATSSNSIATSASSKSINDNSDAAIKRRAARSQRITKGLSSSDQQGESLAEPAMIGVARSSPRSFAVASKPPSLPTVEDNEDFDEDRLYSTKKNGSPISSIRSLSPPPHTSSNDHDVEAQQQKEQERQFRHKSDENDNTTPTTQPGAVAYFPTDGNDDDGSSFLVNSSSNSNKLQDDTDDKADTEKRTTMEFSAESPPTVPPSSSPHPVAEMIDDAEPVVYAKDVQEDDRDFKRRLMVFRILICSIVVVVVSVVVVVVRNNNKDEETVDPYAHLHPECQILMRNNDVIDNSENPKTPIRQCFCDGIIDEQFLKEHFTEEHIQFYHRRVEQSPLIRNVLRENLALYDKNGKEIPLKLGPNVTSCHPLHQSLLVDSLSRSRVQDELDGWEVPQYILDNLLFITYLYVSFDGLNWKDQHGWFSDTDPCNWHGIGCAFVDALTRLSFAENQLSGNLTWTKFWWKRGAPDLRVLDLSRNTEIYGTVPDDLIFQSTALDMLLLEGASLGGGALPEWGTRPLNPRMDRLLLTSNQYTGTLPSHWFEFPPSPSQPAPAPSSQPEMSTSQRRRSIRLRSLAISFNELMGTIPTEIGLATNLVDIQLRSNQINGTLPTEMSNLESLEVLDLGNNSLHGTIPEFLGHLTKLNMLNFFESGLTGNVPESFCDSSSSSSTTNTNSNNGTMSNNNNSPERSRRIFMSCENIVPCSCCGGRGDRDAQVRMLCAEEMPEFVIDDGIS